MITTKKTDRSRHYENHGAPKSKPEQSDTRTLCPMTRKVCLGRECVRFDKDYDICGMSPLSLYNQIRDAVTDAAVEICKAYVGDGQK